MDSIEKNAIFVSEVDGMSSEGLGVCRIEGRAVFVKGALPGEKWRIRIVKVTGAAVYARGEECLQKSPDRTPPACESFGKCGGCALMHMSYEAELRFKLNRINEAFRRIGGLTLEAGEILASERVEGYRNKAVYALGEAGGRPVVGFYRSGSHDIVPLGRCLLQSDIADRTALALRDFIEERGIAPYDPKTGRGGPRHVFTRVSRSGAALCCIVSNKGFGASTQDLVDALRNAAPELTGIVLNVNKSSGNAVLAGDFHTLWGEAELTDTLCGFEFRLSPQSFYQINPAQAERLYTLAVDMAALNKNDTVLDLYCGAGTISLALSRTAGLVIGAEIVPEAIENARQNALRNGVGNTEFICADAGDAARILKERGVRPAAVVVDPPRKGMSNDAVEAVASMGPRRIVYVSCDPATLSRDLKYFTQLKYHPTQAAAVDMFPRTSHVETVVLLTAYL